MFSNKNAKEDTGMVLTKEDMQEIEELFKEKFDRIDARLEEMDTRFEKACDRRVELFLCLERIESTTASLHQGLRTMFRRFDFGEKLSKKYFENILKKL